MEKSLLAMLGTWTKSITLTTNLFSIQVWTVLIMFLCLFDFSSGLLCWHCIAENCDSSPKDNYRAEQRSCVEGQICQKVIFEMQSDIDDTKYKSTVRSCAEECIPQNDYNNCTINIYRSRGCLKRFCCDDDDLCNGSKTLLDMTWYHRFQLLVTTCVINICIFVSIFS